MILKIPDSARSVYQFSGLLQLPYTDPLPSSFNASISSFRHVQYLQLLYLSKRQFFILSFVYCQLQMQVISVSVAKQNSLKNSKIQWQFPDIPWFYRKWECCDIEMHTCSASSLVGVSTTARTPPPRGSWRWCSNGRTNARVLPEPVGAQAISSLRCVHRKHMGVSEQGSLLHLTHNSSCWRQVFPKNQMAPVLAKRENTQKAPQN